MPYATEADLIGAAGGKDRLDELLAKDAPDGEPDVRAYWLAAALAYGDSQINAYLPPRYKVPLESPDRFIVELAAQEAVYWLQVNGTGLVTEADGLRAERRLQELRDLRDGKIWPSSAPAEETRGRRSVVVANQSKTALRKWRFFG